MKVKEIVTRVRAAIDELVENDSDFLAHSQDEDNLTATIIDKIPYALVYIVENAPQEKLDTDMLSSEPLNGFSVNGTTLTGRVKLPTNILRIVAARLSSWKLSPIPVMEYSQEYLMQQDEWARGSWDRPVTAIVHEGADRYLEFYSAKTPTDKAFISYVMKPDVSALATVTMETMESNTAEVNVPTQLEAAFIYEIAALSMVAFREDISRSLFEIAVNYMGNKK